MQLTLNGKPHTLSGPMNLDHLIVTKGLAPEKIVVEHNGVIIKKEKFCTTALNENDTIEIVSFVGGG